MTNEILDALSACVRLSRKQLEMSASSKVLTDTEIVACGALAKPWTAGNFKVGDVRRHAGIVYRCCQAHNSTDNATWSPDAVPALWTQYHTTDPNRAVCYAQPSGAQDAYRVGECVTWHDTVYCCTVDGTVHNPDIAPTAWEIK